MSIFKTKFKLVFVSSCHSKFIGEIFFDNGVGADHVICIKDEDTIWDDVSIEFARILYKTLFLWAGLSICECYNQTIQ